MTTTQIATTNGQQLARPLKVLVPLIQTDLADIDSAELPLKIKVGGELVEAKEQIAAGEWIDWLNKNFELVSRTAQTYMAMWEESEKRTGVRFSSVADFKRKYAERNKKTRAKKRRASGAGLSRADALFKEEKILRKLALELVDAGYRNLSNKYHPDKGGNSETMRRLSSVRKTIKQAVERKEIKFK